MAEAVRQIPATPSGPRAFAGFARTWQRISPRLVPLLAVITALVVTIPFMIITGGEGSVTRGLHIAGTAYSALVEGSLGIAMNDLASVDDVNLALAVADGTDLQHGDISRLARSLTNVTAADLPRYADYATTLQRFDALNMTDDEIEELGTRIPDIKALGVATLTAMRPLITELEAAPRPDVRNLAEQIAALTSLDEDSRANIEATAPSAADYNDEDLLTHIKLVDSEGIVKLDRTAAQLDVLAQVGLDPASPEAAELAAIVASGLQEVRDSATLGAILSQAGVLDPSLLAEQLRLVDNLYEDNLLTNDNVSAALREELAPSLADNLVIRRPRNRVVVDLGKRPLAGVTRLADGKPETLYVRLGKSALVFFPANLEVMIVRSIPFVIAGLAVALGFKAGLFNIGAEGQLFAAGTMAAWVGFSGLFNGLPGFLHVPLVIVAGIFGGFVYGAIPGLLKAYAGAHEVINTIMLNLIALRLVDWLIKSTDPLILLDTTASTPRTPFLVDSARLPTFGTMATYWFVIAALAVLAVSAYSRRERIQSDPMNAARPVIQAGVVLLVGLFVRWISVVNQLHIGLVLMIFAVWFTEWFLDRTTYGFELRTVGMNANAARYAGMSVRRNTVLALALSGALAGLAGGIEISGVQHNMQPEFFSGLGFEAIAVALLARNNPRSMIPAGFLWGALLAGSGLMQVRADISRDLVQIIQALIIMFVAADAIIRYLWRVPEATAEEKAGEMRLSSWGG